MQFKIAAEPWEFEAIHRLNYRTFVEEIPQHAGNAERRLVDRFHEENTYAICLAEGRLVGMVCGRGRRPFSLDQKLPDLDAHLPAGRRVFEIRLLAVEPAYRRPSVFARLAAVLAGHFRNAGFDLAVISGTTRQLGLYEHLGFVPFGPLVGKGEARFQPMYLTLKAFLRSGRAVLRHSTQAINFLCGPVSLSEEVRQAFAAAPVSHRCDRFMADFSATRRMLCELTGARDVQVLLGSGTLANDAVAAQLVQGGGKGLLLSNGEFGERLVDHASRHGARFEAMRWDWGRPFDYDEVDRRLGADPDLRWLWAVHCETSTGMLNDIEALKAICARHSVKLCLDCVSAIGAVPVDLAGVAFATCASGKALASFAGLSMVFHSEKISPCRALPRYLDLGYYASWQGMPFTGSSNLIHALQASLRSTPWLEKFRRVAQAGAWLRRELGTARFETVAPAACAAPAVVTIALPGILSSRRAGMHLRQEGFLTGYESSYLLQRNWLQIALMGDFAEASLRAFVDALALYRDSASRRSRLTRHRQSTRHADDLPRDVASLV